MFNVDINFLIGCLGAFAPETWRLYNLRSKAVFKWSWGYIFFSIPFLLMGGFIAWILEPSNKWSAFYSGLTTPILLTTVMKDTAKAQRELEKVEKECNFYQHEKDKLEKKHIKLIKGIKETLPLTDKEIEEIMNQEPNTVATKSTSNQFEHCPPKLSLSDRIRYLFWYVQGLFQEFVKAL